ncbi:MAG: hypothetical protein Q8O67_15650 [Deltaproteobacteria bacterium]|nr:hypothetical protein [Deltaproteobacteria bacterium]
MKRPLYRIFQSTVAMGLSLGLSCTNAQLAPVPPPEVERADNKLAVEGRFCTTDPDELAFPVKLMFLIDTSSSMEATDPEITRVQALLAVIEAVKDIPGVEIAIVIFGLGVSPLTEKCDDYVARTNCVPGFAPPDEALLVAGGASQAAGTTDFILTLQSAIGLLADDMSNSNPLDLQNARYSIIMLSDGLADSDGTFDPVGTCNDAAEWARAGEAIPNAGVVTQTGELLEQIIELARQYDVPELTFNSAFAAAPQITGDIKACGSNFMRAMSKQSGGIFRDFSSGEEINFLFVDFTSFKRIFAMKSFLAVNINAAPFSQAFDVDKRVRSDDPTLAIGIIDSDADGLSDSLEDKIGTDPQVQDTDNDGFSDLLEHRLSLSGSDALDPTDADCKADVDRLDADGDGLRDCEERFFGTNIRAYDTDVDGFGDGVEVLSGLNPGLDDTLLDVDFDGVRNNNELRAHSSVDQDDVLELSEHAYRYRVIEDGLEGSSICYSFRVENIALASTTGASGPPPDATGAIASSGLAGGVMEVSENRIIFEVTEQPFDSSSEQGVARLACARARFDAERQLKDPANGVIVLPESAFKTADLFDPLVDCIDP